MRVVIGALALALLAGHFALAWGRLADEKCEEYSQAFRRRRDIASYIYSFFYVTAPKKEATQPGEFPHMAHLGVGDADDKTFSCGGTLISDQYVLTTATCTTVDVLLLHNRKKRAMKAEHKTESSEESEDDDEDDEESEKLASNRTIKWVQFGDKADETNLYSVEDIIIHPDHIASGLYNDIALIKLDRVIDFNAEIHPACLSTKEDDITNTTVVATGWGALAFDEDLSDELMKIPLTVLTDEECNNGGAVILYLHEGMDDNQFCVGGREKANTLCQGDGGGPLQVKNEDNPNMFDVVGLIAFGYMCNALSVPVYATRVSSFVPWIESIVWPEGS